MPSLEQRASAIADGYQPPTQRIDDYARLTDDEKALIYSLHRTDKTQTEIAQVVGCSQSAVSRWLKKLDPTVDIAKSYAHNRALAAVESLERAWPAAEEHGKSGPQEAMLKIAGLMSDESSGPKVIVQIGVKDSDVQIQMISVSSTPSTLSPPLSDDMHRLSAEESTSSLT